MPASLRRPVVLAATAVAGILTLAGCASSTSGGSQGTSTPVAVSYDDTACAATPTTVPSGAVEISATYTGSGTAEVYLYGKDGDAFTKIVGEVENLTNGLTKAFTADVSAGAYEIKCEAGGNETRTPLTVT